MSRGSLIWGIEDRKMFRPVARGHYAPAVSGKQISLFLHDSGVLWLLVSEQNISSNGWSPLQMRQHRGDDVVKWQASADRELLGLFFMPWLFGILFRVLVYLLNNKQSNSATRLRRSQTCQSLERQPVSSLSQKVLYLKFNTAVWKTQMRPSLEWMSCTTFYTHHICSPKQC